MNNVGSQAADIVRDGDVTTADHVAFTSGGSTRRRVFTGRKSSRKQHFERPRERYGAELPI